MPLATPDSMPTCVTLVFDLLEGKADWEVVPAQPLAMREFETFVHEVRVLLAFR